MNDISVWSHFLSHLSFPANQGKQAKFMLDNSNVTGVYFEQNLFSISSSWKTRIGPLGFCSAIAIFNK